MQRSAVLASVLLVCACKGTENELTTQAFIEPELEITSPEAAAWLADGKVLVTGRAVGVEGVEVNGSSVEVEGDQFSTVIELSRGINTLEVRGTDGNGTLRYARHSVIAGEFADPGRPVEEGVALRVNTSGLDFAMDKAGAMLADLDLDSAVTAANPVYEDSYGILGWDAVSVRADIGDLSLGKIDLDAEPEDGYLELTVTVPDLEVWVPVQGDIVGWDFDVDAWVWASEAEVTAYVTLGTDGEGGLTAELYSPDIQLYGFGYDTSLIPGEVETWILVDEVRGLLEDMIVAQVEEAVPPMLAEELEKLDIAFETELMGKELSLNATFASASVDRKGVELVTDVDLNIPGNGGVTYGGYLTTESEPAEVSRSADVALAMSDDLLNRMLFEVWRAGLADMTLSSADGSLDEMILAKFKASEGEITVHADLPPVAVERDGALRLQVGELIVDVNTPGGGLGEHMQMAVALDAGVDLEVVEGELAIAIVEPELVITVRDTDWGRGASTESVNTLMDQSLPAEALIGLVGDLAFELPSFAGITIDDAEVLRNDTGAHTDILVNLK